jgi:hypothetical protein
LKLPDFAERELESISSRLSPIKLDIGDLLLHQQDYHKKAVVVEGRVKSVVSIDETDEETVASWGWNIIPTTVKSAASATYFYITNDSEEIALVKYLADLDVCGDDNVVVTGIFNASVVTIETKGLLRTRKEQVTSELGEPFITAITIENTTKQKTEYIRQT